MDMKAFKTNFLTAAEIRRLGDTWQDAPVEKLRALKEASKGLCTVRYIGHFKRIANSEAFQQAEKAMNAVCDRLVTTIGANESPFAQNFEVNWKMATMLSRMHRYKEALAFVERAEKVMPTGNFSKADNVDNKKGRILLELHLLHPDDGYGTRAHMVVADLYERTKDPDHESLLHKVRRALSGPEASAAYAHS